MQLSLGPVTSIVTTCAAVAGAGVLLGGLVAGIVGTTLSWSRERLESRVRQVGYVGGGLALLAALAESI